jgi:hypothetical protein
MSEGIFYSLRLRHDNYGVIYEYSSLKARFPGVKI